MINDPAYKALRCRIFVRSRQGKRFSLIFQKKRNMSGLRCTFEGSSYRRFKTIKLIWVRRRVARKLMEDMK